MSRSLTALVPPSLANQLLVDLDEECEHIPVSQEVQISRGPFGAFRLSRDPASPHSVARVPDGVASASAIAYLPTGSSSPVGDPTTSDEDCTGFSSIRSEEIDAIDALLFESMFDIPSTSSAENLSQAIDLLPQLEESVRTPFLPQFTIDPTPKNWSFPPARSPQMQWAALGGPSREKNSFPVPQPALASTHPPLVPPNVSVLLQNYSTRVLSFLTPFRHSKTPWHIMFIPLAKQCVAGLALGEVPDHAILCAFYSILATSAFSLAGTSQAQVLFQEAQVYEQRARHHCRLMLETAYVIPKKAKYKSILIALLSMIQLSMCRTGYEAADYYFLEAEKFIRLRGLKRTKSRKVRLLHHCYTYWRMFHESIYTGGRPSGHRQRILQAIESNALVVYSYDSPSFRLSTCTDLSHAMRQVKTQEVGENDLHIELPGTWPPTLYPEIFGLPEPWLFLLSLIVRLGKEKDAAAANQQQSSPTNPLTEFLTRAKTIETFLRYLHHQREAEHHRAAAEYHLGADLLTLHCLMDAAAYAVEILFYRRIYDLDASLLQGKVKCVHDCLLRCSPRDRVGAEGEEAEAGPDNSGHGLAGLIWPAFIAACEAEDPAMQATFAAWFRRFARQSGLYVFLHVLRVVEEIWEQKKTAAGVASSWGEIMQRGLQRAAAIAAH
ncbi:fungal-specific transcription factor domain-containing protein [Aspergillus karnatakaensis]|uniref:fungal specific transcription factor domain-containing protein n=1 Tax=Aspergillus karnatakaensis TaxID=1810916 RepID=UPI003CCD1DE0